MTNRNPVAIAIALLGFLAAASVAHAAPVPADSVCKKTTTTHVGANGALVIKTRTVCEYPASRMQ